MVKKLAQKLMVSRSRLIITILLVIIILMAVFGYLFFYQIDPVELLPSFGPVVSVPEYIFSIDPKQGGLSNPMAVTVNKNRVYVTDSNNHRIIVTDKNGKLLRTFGKYGAKDGELNYPVSIAAKDKFIFVADLQNKRIAIFDEKGQFVKNWPDKTTSHLKGIRPLSLSIHSDGRIFVADAAKQRIVVLNQDGVEIQSIGSPGSGPGEFSYVNGLAIDEEGKTLFVADSNNRRIQTWGLDGTFKGIIAENLLTPRGIGYRQDDTTLFVADTLANRVIAIDLEDSSAGQVSFNHVGDDDVMKFPHGITVDDVGRIYVTEKQANRVNVYR